MGTSRTQAWTPQAGGLTVLAIDPAGEVVQQDPADGVLPAEVLCVAFISREGRLEGAARLAERFAADERLAAVAMARVDVEGNRLASVCMAPAASDLLCRLVLSWKSKRCLLGLGLPIGGFEHDRALSVESVHPCAWAVRATHWGELVGLSDELGWEYGVQALVDRVCREGLEVFYLPDVRVSGVRTSTDAWCRPLRDLATLRGLFGYIRGRWGDRRARLFRRLFKPLFLVRLWAELLVRVLLFRWKCRGVDRRSMTEIADIARFVTVGLIDFIRAREPEHATGAD